MSPGRVRDADVVDHVVLPPDPGLVASLGSNHTIDSAVADLIDNSLDAEASIVRVSLTTIRNRLQTLAVLDNGRGMDFAQANDAMTIGRRRRYKRGSLGNFGLGLKAAALGCADTLTVWSHTPEANPVGRRIRRRDLLQDFGCDILAPQMAATQAKQLDEQLGGISGTAVVLDNLRRTYRGASHLEAQTFLHSTTEHLRIHLGVVFHRWVTKRGIRIEIEVNEITDKTPSMSIPVAAIDPFGYLASGHPDYPRTLRAPLDIEHPLKLRCHIWPAKNDITGFRMGRRSGDSLQGFYIYRSDRLLQIGGWDSVSVAKPERQLARVIIDDDMWSMIT